MTFTPQPLRPRLTIPISPGSPEETRTRDHNALEVTRPFVAESVNNSASALLISPAAMPQPNIHTIPNDKTGSGTYIVADPVTEEAVVINPVLDFDLQTNRISTRYADAVLDIIRNEGYTVAYILETGIHRRHISACRYLQDKVSETSGQKPQLCIGRNLGKTRGDLSPERSCPDRLSVEKQSFDKLFADGEKFRIGNIVGEVMHLSTKARSSSGSSSELVAYLIGHNILTDVPNGVGSLSEGSRQKLFEHSDEQKLLVLGVPLKPSESTTTPVTIKDLKEVLEATALSTTEATPSPTTEAKSAMEFYATRINARGGRIPKKINLIDVNGEENGKQKESTPRPLLIPKKLEMLLC